MTKREAAIVSAFTGRLLGEFDEYHAYIEEIMGRPVFTHELGNRIIAKEISSLAKQDFTHIIISNL